jgi:hypothetical protein
MRYKALLTAASLQLAVLPAVAHHSFVSQYDPNQLITLEGVVSNVEWLNPHVYIYVDVRDTGGDVTTWALEGLPPNSLKRTGLPREMFNVGDEIIATAYAARDGSHRAAGREITFPDGSRKFLGLDRTAGTNRAVVRPAAGQKRGSEARSTVDPSAVPVVPIPRTPDGKPDLSGTWQAGGVDLVGQPVAPPLHPLPPTKYSPPPRQPIPYQAWTSALRKNLTVVDDPTTECFPPGVPRVVGLPMPFQIVQTPKLVVVLHEAFRVWRRIPIDDDLKHPDDLTPTWMGDAVGRWEGDTFVVDSIGFNDKTWLDSSVGSIHTEQLHVVERYQLNDDGTLSWEATVEDPGALTKPWVIGRILRRTAPSVRVEEYVCLEAGRRDNVMIRGIIDSGGEDETH